MDAKSGFDAYIVARMAQWAGDFGEALRLYGTCVPDILDRGNLEESLTGPIEMVQYAAAVRRHQIQQRIAEFESLKGSLRLGELTYQPYVLVTDHVRGAI